MGGYAGHTYAAAEAVGLTAGAMRLPCSPRTVTKERQ